MGRVLVCGHSGFIGSHLVKRLLDQGHDVHGISRTHNNLVSGVKNFCLDANDKKGMESLIRDISPEILFSLHANAAEGKSQFSPIEITQNNIGIFMNTIVPFIKYGGKKFIFTSSVAVYGSMLTPFKESDPPIPQDIYGINKLAIERSLRILAKVHGFDYGIVRPHNVYGPGQNMKDPYRNVVTLFMNSILKNEPYYIYGDGEMRRCFSYIDDVVDVIAQMYEPGNEGLTVNVGSDKSHSINELSDAIRKVSKTEVPIKYIKDRPQEVHIAESDHTVCKKLFGYKDTSLEEGIKKTWEWCKSQGPQELEFTDVEIPSKKLPEVWKK